MPSGNPNASLEEMTIRDFFAFLRTKGSTQFTVSEVVEVIDVSSEAPRSHRLPLIYFDLKITNVLIMVSRDPYNFNRDDPSYGLAWMPWNHEFTELYTKANFFEDCRVIRKRFTGPLVYCPSTHGADGALILYGETDIVEIKTLGAHQWWF